MKSLKYLLPFAVAALTACSSMEIEDTESMVENTPTDFDAQKYLSLHPQLRYLQIKDAVAAYNENVKATLGNDYNKTANTEKKSYAANTVLLQNVLTQLINVSAWQPVADIAESATALADVFSADLNFVGSDDDANLLATVISQLDTSGDLEKMQYILYGKSHGWPYRPCTAEEIAKCPNGPEYACEENTSTSCSTTKLYCDVNGLPCEIK